ncbi:hypothetical protein [Neobacillus sp. PS2-9]|uniref:hypothetical protein n=1 Tax=Neobacillus sp. PS2-9 TaxID=3070676 RepID=UPI0027E1F6E1|nr:hypothetical protein [Neobacillus sp. PS2-9]WML60554.1 hypothetical protein RCG25_12670 [Neobacillus sp. PS2-9]
MSVFTLLTLAACNEKNLEAAKTIQQKLKEKYGQEFVVDRIGGGYGTLHSNTLKAIVYPKETVSKKFSVEITMDLNNMWDSYMNIVMAEKLDTEVRKLVDHYFDDPYHQKTYLSSTGMSFPDQSLTDRGISIKTYLKNNSEVIIYFFVKCDKEVNLTNLAERLHEFANEAISLGVKEAYIRLFLVKPATYQQIDQKQELLIDSIEAYDYYSKKDHTYQHSWLTIENSIILESAEDIQRNFK